MNWRKQIFNFTEQGDWDLYMESGEGIRIRQEQSGTVVEYANSEFDQVFLREKVDLNDFSVKMRLQKQPETGSRITLGFVDSYKNREGKKRNIVFNRGDGSFLAFMIWMEFLSPKKIQVSFRADTKEPNWGGFKYYTQYEGAVFRHLLSAEESFEGHEFHLRVFRDGEHMVSEISDDRAVCVKNGKTTDTLRCTLPASGWNGLTIHDFPGQKGYFFVEPGVGSSLVFTEEEEWSRKVPVTDLGINDGFWNYTPFPLTSPQFPFEKFPEILGEDGAFTKGMVEQKGETVLFSQGMNLVRFLGGWNGSGNTLYGKNLGRERVSAYDLVYRKPDGTIGYRFGEEIAEEENMIRMRLDPFIEKGFTDIRLVLDNIPYCFPQKDYIGEVYGQSALPADLEEWSAFMEQFLLELIRLYGRECVGKWSFRLATEGDDYGRFSGCLQDYCSMYAVSAETIQKIIPEARFGPYNVLNDYNHLMEVVKYAAENHLKLDCIASSVYVEDSCNPDDFIENIGASVQKIRRLSPKKETLSYEIHEYDWLTMASGFFGRITDVRGVAGNFHTMMNLRKIGADRIYHWGITEHVVTKKGKYEMVTGQIWLLSVLSAAMGTRMYELPWKSLRKSDTCHKVVGFFGGGVYPNMIVVSSYHLDPGKKEEDEIQIRLPEGLAVTNPAETELREIVLKEENDWYSQMREDFSDAGILAEPWKHLGFVARPYNVASTPEAAGGSNPKWMEIFEENYEKYQENSRNSLTVKKSEVRVERREDGFCLKQKVETPSAYVWIW